MTPGHCPTCVCGRRAPVQEHRGRNHPVDSKGPGTIAWWEHEQAWAGYAARYGSSQSAERLAQRGGFGYGELVEFLGREPETWSVRGDTRRTPDTSPAHTPDTAQRGTTHAQEHPCGGPDPTAGGFRGQ